MMKKNILILILIMQYSCINSQNNEEVYEEKYYSEGKDTIFYQLLSPIDQKKNKKYPLILFLHGAGSRGNDNKKQLTNAQFLLSEKNRKNHPAFAILPQCPKNRRWVEVSWSIDKHNMPVEPSLPMRLVINLLEDFIQKNNIDKNRIYVTGLSMGGFGTWDIICRKPDMFAAAVPLCGGGDEKQADKIVNIPIWAFHGDKDNVIKVERSRNMIEALNKLGAKPKYTEYKGKYHGIWDTTYKRRDLIEWMFTQKRKK